ncbi:hypothetical protein Pa4123_68300 [Phytohabitans aurantiacus]|uniref:Uncharacterized protein n=1 Tax=Phytohabitans aurantiacus TaxID=3016789 RepID=A0ABQ5R447_9ACTN|nr:hypothetical protein Pa4123_68300 [Phytohabitans aurantiacus]
MRARRAGSTYRLRAVVLERLATGTRGRPHRATGNSRPGNPRSNIARILSAKDVAMRRNHVGTAGDGRHHQPVRRLRCTGASSRRLADTPYVVSRPSAPGK